MVPIFMLALFSSKCLRVDVLPDPRKPARRMTGMGCFLMVGLLTPSTGEEDALREVNASCFGEV